MTQIHKAEGSAAGLFGQGEILPQETISDIKQFESRSNFLLESMAATELGGTKDTSALLCLYDTEDTFDDEIRFIGKSLEELDRKAVSFGINDMEPSYSSLENGSKIKNVKNPKLEVPCQLEEYSQIRLIPTRNTKLSA